MAHEKVDVSPSPTHRFSGRPTIFSPQIMTAPNTCLQVSEKTIQKKNVRVKMTLTSPHCPAAESLPTEVKDSIMDIKEVDNVELDLVWEPPWDKDMMSEAAKLELNI